METKTRFSKYSMIDSLLSRLERLEEEYNFDRRNGYSQVIGKSEEFNRAYGEYNCIQSILWNELDTR